MPSGNRRQADDALVLALACGSTIEAAAQKAGVHRTTVQRRMADPVFRAKLAKARSDMIERATAMLSAASMEAVKTLLDLQDKKSPPTARLGAARSVLEIGSRLRVENELMSRLEATERALGLRA
jgi:hypothetical protein